MASDPPALKAAVGRLLSRLLPGLTMGNGVNPAHVSQDPAIIQAYSTDPLVHDRVSARWFTEIVQAQGLALGQAGSLSLPALVMQAGDDRLVSAAATRTFHERLASPDKQYVEWPGLFHEIFNAPRVERERVHARLLDWLVAHS